MANRLKVNEDRVRELIHSRAELFTQVVSSDALTAWKDDIISGDHWPVWVRELLPEQRTATIEGIDSTDVFRSPFRDPNSREPDSIEVINWGIEHIERLYKAQAESREERKKFWSTIVIPAAVPVVTVLFTSWIALTSLWTSSDVQRAQLGVQRAQLQMQQDVSKWQNRVNTWEFSLRDRVDGYRSVMESLEQGYEAATRKEPQGVTAALNKMKTASYRLEPFIEDSNPQARMKLENQYLPQFSNLLERIISGGLNPGDGKVQVNKLRSEIHSVLYQDLFEMSEEDRRAISNR
jgi:hypothetical protein